MAFVFGTNSPCGACKFLRRKCTSDCIFAPYFCSEQGPAKFAAIHKVFGASNVSKLLSNIPAHARHEAAITIAYEAQARLRDPVYGCVAHIFALQQQVAYLQAQVMQEKTQLLASGIVNNGSLYRPSCLNSIYPESSLESIDGIKDGDLAFMLEDDMGELQGLAGVRVHGRTCSQVAKHISRVRFLPKTNWQ